MEGSYSGGIKLRFFPFMQAVEKGTVGLSRTLASAMIQAYEIAELVLSRSTPPPILRIWGSPGTGPFGRPSEKGRNELAEKSTLKGWNPRARGKDSFSSLE